MSGKIEQILGMTVFDADGAHVGNVVSLHSCAGSDELTWATVTHGFTASREALVPLTGCEITPDGVWLGTDKQTVKAAPAVEVDGPLAAADVARLVEHYYGQAAVPAEP